MTGPRSLLVAAAALVCVALTAPAQAAGPTPTGSPWGFEAEASLGGTFHLNAFNFPAARGGGGLNASFWIPYRTRSGAIGVRTSGRFQLYGTARSIWSIEARIGLQQTWRTGPGSSFVFTADWVVAGFHPGVAGYLGPCVGIGFNVGSPEWKRARIQIRPAETCLLGSYGVSYTASVGVAFGPRPAWVLND